MGTSRTKIQRPQAVGMVLLVLGFALQVGREACLHPAGTTLLLVASGVLACALLGETHRRDA